MSLDNIQIPISIIQSLYGKSLYDLKVVKDLSTIIESNDFSFLGSNQKNIVLVVSSSLAIYLPDEELNFLLGILTACKLSMADIALINMKKNPALIYTNITSQLNAEKIFLFGLEAQSLKLTLQFENYQIQNYNNQVYLSSVSLSELQKDNGEKLKLWNCLKTIFSL